MQFEHTFRRDLLILMNRIGREPFAFARFADGERAVMERTEIQSADGWSVDPEPNEFEAALWESLRYEDPGYHLGLGCPCCDHHTWQMLMSNTRTPMERVTFSNLFVNSNFEPFHEILDTRELLAHSRLVACKGQGNFSVPVNLVNYPGAIAYIDGVVQTMLEASSDLIFVAAGPASSIIIHRYWKWMRENLPNRSPSTVIDIGSALDLAIHATSFDQAAGATRGYHSPDSLSRSKVCLWPKQQDTRRWMDGGTGFVQTGVCAGVVESSENQDVRQPAAANVDSPLPGQDIRSRALGPPARSPGEPAENPFDFGPRRRGF